MPRYAEVYESILSARRSGIILAESLSDRLREFAENGDSDGESLLKDCIESLRLMSEELSYGAELMGTVFPEEA